MSERLTRWLRTTRGTSTVTDPNGRGNWSERDESADSDHFERYLETATSFDAIRAYKARSHDRLELHPGDAVLDAGCGIGDDALALADLVAPTGKVVGIDNSERLIERASERSQDRGDVHFRVDDIYDLGFGADEFDASRADRVLQHLDRPRDAVRELRRVTRPGGRLGLTEPDWGSLVIDAPGDGKPHELLDPEYAVPKQPEIGRRLYRLARELGLESLSVDSFMVNTTDFAFTYEMAELERWTSTMAADGEIEEDILSAWRDRLAAADEAGTFFAALPAHTVTGTVPE